MNPDDNRDVVLFTEALKLPVEERDAFLRRACGDDTALREKVEALLKAQDRIGDFLEKPAATLIPPPDENGSI